MTVRGASLSRVTDTPWTFTEESGRARGEPADALVVVDGLRFGQVDGWRGAVVRATGAELTPGQLGWTVDLAPRASWSTCIEISAVRGGAEVEPRVRCDVDVLVDG